MDIHCAPKIGVAQTLPLKLQQKLQIGEHLTLHAELVLQKKFEKTTYIFFSYCLK